MPELPEVERVKTQLGQIVAGKDIVEVEMTQDRFDSDMFVDITADEFRDAVLNRMVQSIGRHGSVLFFALSGTGKTPVIQLGPDAILHAKGRMPFSTYTARKNKLYGLRVVWPPPRYIFMMRLECPTNPTEVAEFAFLDSTRKSRIYLCDDPYKESPISELGSDPLLEMMPFDEFAGILKRRKRATKTVIVDQRLLAGVGEWVAGTYKEALYQARVHPEEPSHLLSVTDARRLHETIVYVCQYASQLPDCSDYPRDWLFHYRGKGRPPKHKLLLPDGTPASVQFHKSGGHSSVYVKELQHRTDLGEEFEYSGTIVRKRKEEEEDNRNAKRSRVH